MESKSAQRIYKTIMLIIIVIITTSLITAFATYQYLRNNVLAIRKGNNTSFEGLEYTLSQFRTELENKYIGEINDEELIDGALKGYVNALGDPYTTYYTKEEMKEIMEETNGNFVGIGNLHDRKHKRKCYHGYKTNRKFTLQQKSWNITWRYYYQK